MTGKKHFEGNLVIHNATIMGKVGSVDLFELKSQVANRRETNHIEGNVIFRAPAKVKNLVYEGK